MKFILWTLVYWGMLLLELRLVSMPMCGGPEKYHERFNSVLGYSGFIHYLLYIGLYIWFVR
jgi:hypothetical protein